MLLVNIDLWPKKNLNAGCRCRRSWSCPGGRRQAINYVYPDATWATLSETLARHRLVSARPYAGICSIENSHVFLFFYLGRVGVSSLAGTSYGNTVQVHHWDGDSRIRVTVSLLFPHFVAAIRARSACRTDASITHLLHSVAKAGRSWLLLD